VTDWSLKDKVIMITGGARGIGAGTAEALARRGARPVLADLDTEALATTAAAMSPTTLTIELDVTDAAACEAAVARVLTSTGGSTSCGQTPASPRSGRLRSPTPERSSGPST
jgi:NAD(P)-dependent dehydrogenase (short-subunit alcohol dehydrogenase family)